MRDVKKSGVYLFDPAARHLTSGLNFIDLPCCKMLPTYREKEDRVLMFACYAQIPCRSKSTLDMF